MSVIKGNTTLPQDSPPPKKKVQKKSQAGIPECHLFEASALSNGKLFHVSQIASQRSMQWTLKTHFIAFL